MASATEANQQANRAGMDPVRLVVIFLLLATVVAGMFLEQILTALFAAAGIADPVLIEGTDGRLSTVLGYVLAIAGAVFVWMNPKSRQLSTEVASELMKVTWPSWAETRTATMAVVVASLVAAIILFGIDTLAYKLMVDWLPKVWGAL